MVIDWGGLNDAEQQQLKPILSSTDNWILLTQPLGASNKTLAPLRETKLIARADGESSRHKGWWREGKDKLASHSMTTEVWTSTQSHISSDTVTKIQEALEADDSKDKPFFGEDQLETVHRLGTEAELLGIYSFPGVVDAIDGSNDKGIMGADFYRLDESRGGSCQLGRGEEGNSLNRAELGAACLALEDAKKREDDRPILLLTASACLLTSIQKWTGEGKSPSMWGNPDADILRDIIQLLRERTDLELFTIFSKIQAHRGDPQNEVADRWADEGRDSEVIRWSLPTNRPIFS